MRQQGTNRRCVPIDTDLLKTTSCRVSLGFPEWVLQIVHETKHNTLGKGVQCGSGSLEILDFEDPISSLDLV